jgi:subtilisin-like proprotein convertase family protein
MSNVSRPNTSFAGFLVSVALLSFVFSCSDDRICFNQDNRCHGITCSGHGTCTVLEGETEVTCICDEGYHNENATSCVPDFSTCDGKEDGTFCDDGSFCTVAEICTGGVCGGGSVRNCSDGDSCTTDVCNEIDDICEYTSMADDDPCDDGMYCTVGEVCTAGVCGGGTPIDCSDGDPCTLDLCDDANNICDHPPADDGIECDDGEYCSTEDICISGVCMAATFRDCSDGNPCTTDTCDEVGDSCQSTEMADGTACDDSQYCSIGSVCTAGVCGDGSPRTCSDGNPCTADSCDEDNDACLNTNLDNGTVCDDGAYCTMDDVCSDGVCGGSTARDCNDGNACTSNVCNETVDSCENLPVVDGTPCDDGQFCTVDDVCTAGSCVGPNARDCSDGDQCTSDACDDVADGCVNANVPDGTVCSDGLFCTLGETCTLGVCGGGSGRDCTDGNPCTIDSCNDTTSTCDHVNEADGSVCDDGRFCTLNDVCATGVCTGTLNPCDDSNGCTLDSCDDATSQCVNDQTAMDGAGCDDGEFCTVADTCAAGICGGSPNLCDDSNACTADSCDEAGDVCDHAPVADGTVCDDSLYCSVGDVCNAGTCSGSARDCGDANVCTADSCNEVADECANIPVADGAACDDGAFCNVGENCVGGICGGGQARNCSDGNECTTDSCDEVGGTCLNNNVADGTACDDSAFCTVGEVCTTGVCGGGGPTDCDDGNVCTNDVCDETNDVCDHPAEADGLICDDGEYCTISDSCSAGACVGGGSRVCGDANPCTVDTCDEVGNSCVNTDLADGTACDDGAYCNLGETCTAGICGGGGPRSCSDGNSCTADSCDEVGDTCVNNPAADGSVCDDGTFCTVGETCSAGLCGNGSPRDCTDGNDCTSDICDEAGGVCSNPPVADGTVCSDGQYCSNGDQCLAGVCDPGPARDCSDGNQCTVDSCNDVTNQCVNDAVAAEGNLCNDLAFCTVNESCSAGVCAGGAARDCGDLNECTIDSCDEVGDQCVNDAPLANGNPCDDGLFCNENEACSNGICAGGTPLSCADINQCTIDSCDEAGDTCVNDPLAANGNGCDDGQFCNLGETCLAGICQGGAPNTCSDGNGCTADSCNEAGDVCVNDAAAMNGNACEDGSFCTVSDTCNGGVCSSGSARDCTDVDPCTNDSCNEATNVCDHNPVANGTPCDNGLFCTIGSVCNGGACGGGGPNLCDDSNDCTSNVCDEGNDICVNNPLANGTGCDDGAFCTINESCTAGVCGGGAPNLCDDSNPCTLDTCVEPACVNDPVVMNGVPCDNGLFCTIDSTCNAGSCAGGSVRSCDDSNSCTSDSCDEAGDTCLNPVRANGSACDDSQFCTVGDTCQAGVCQSGAGAACGDGNPCTNDSCDEINDLCAYDCVAAGTRCLDATQEATCDGACNATQLIICSYGCNAGRQECNECNPSSLECRADIEFLCNAEFICDAVGLITSKTCCSSGRCTCDGSACLEDICATAPDVSAGGNYGGNTCDDLDNIPGDCFPGGSACQSVASGGGPEEFFQFTLNDGTGTSAFYTVTLTSAGYDTTLRTSTVCGSETDQVPTADVCGAPGIDPEQACSEEIGPEVMTLCGLPEGTYFGAVDSAPFTCGGYNLNVGISQVDLDDGPEAGNISMGGTFTGNTCALADDFSFPDVQGINGCTGLGDCIFLGGSSNDCPACDAAAATDCDIGINSTDSLCSYNGAGGPDAVFYLALAVDSGIDISTVGSDFDTVLFIMQTGPSGTTPPGSTRLCNDDCYSGSGESHIQTSLPAGLYYVYVDGAGGACGNYQLNVMVSPAATCPNLGCESPHENCENCPFDCPCPNCPDGAVDTAEGEECDDNNSTDGDGCSSKCVVEDGYTCTGEPSSCIPQFFLDQSSACSCAIPDLGTRIDTLSIGSACTIIDINVDMNITHTWIGDLTITLESPNATIVTLHNASGGSADNIIGNYEATLTVDGPGALADFIGGPGNGTWTLTVDDGAFGDTGTLNSWGIHLTCQ